MPRRSPRTGRRMRSTARSFTTVRTRSVIADARGVIRLWNAAAASAVRLQRRRSARPHPRSHRPRAAARAALGRLRCRHAQRDDALRRGPAEGSRPASRRTAPVDRVSRRAASATAAVRSASPRSFATSRRRGRSASICSTGSPHTARQAVVTPLDSTAGIAAFSTRRRRADARGRRTRSITRTDVSA